MTWSKRRWTLTVTPEGVTYRGRSGTAAAAAEQLLKLKVRRTWFIWTLRSPAGRLAWLPGLNRTEAEQLAREIRRAGLHDQLDAAGAWIADVDRTLDRYRREQRWLPLEELQRLETSRPDRTLRERLTATGIWDLLEQDQADTFAHLERDLGTEVEALNEQTMRKELQSRADFFRTIERTPLTEEQAKAVVCFDNRVQLLAAAGSGKTSVMVARAAYAVARGFVRPDRILLLAFNRAAADELQERVSERFAASGIESTGVRASTFHAFGLDCIARATGRKPSLAQWVEQGQDARKILEIAERLKAEDPQFRVAWAEYRHVYGRQRYPLGEEPPDARDPESRKPGFNTVRGEIVKSHGERMIADWLLLNGVEYEYEKSYTVDLSDQNHRQYRPDFYYPGIDAWHEHWAIMHDGRPPQAFAGYQESMDWKKGTHAEHGTDLIETTAAQVMREGLGPLASQLTERGVVLEPDERRMKRPQGRDLSVKETDLARLILTFMSHVKSSGLTWEDIESKLTEAGEEFAVGRARVFMGIYWKIHDRWETELAQDHSIDFNDMLLQAADHVQSGRYQPPYDLILVDELQDTSRARAKLIQGLVGQPSRYLLAVGDDWQAINRFAGADISVMTEFEDWFGHGPQLALTKTFRCTQAICDVAREFIMKNPSQFDKEMTSAHGPGGTPVHVLGPPPPEEGDERPMTRDEKTRRAVAHALKGLAEDVRKGNVTPTKGPRVTVDILGRYSFVRESSAVGRFPANLDVTFRTVHSAKGLEADCVIVPSLISDVYGFPSAIVDDPVLALAMPRPDDYPDAEERRLFYVALTRARQRVILVTLNENPSPFIFELLQDSKNGEKVTAEFIEDGVGGTCRTCRQGHLQWKTGKFGPFLSCSRYPACDFTQNSGRDAKRSPRTGRYSQNAASRRGDYKAGGTRTSSRGGRRRRAMYPGTCPLCRGKIVVDQMLRLSESGWAHDSC